jgi:hypothetical protein
MGMLRFVLVKRRATMMGTRKILINEILFGKVMIVFYILHPAWFEKFWNGLS